jgi:hypothetical protein
MAIQEPSAPDIRFSTTSALPHQFSQFCYNPVPTTPVATEMYHAA